MTRDGPGQARLGASTFDAIAALAHRESGLKIVPEKRMMVQSRLRHRLRALALADFEAYAQLVCSTNGSQERRLMISALTTNVSHFFREAHHFDALSTLLRARMRHAVTSGARIRIWSAGCSNGQEAFSIAMHLLRAEPALGDADFRILATDIDPKVIAFARDARYGAQMIEGVSDADKAAFMTGGPETFTICDRVRRCVAFRELNLLSEWPMQHRFDAIFCRNVVIYFDLATQERLWPRLHDALGDEGVFFLGHSERIATAAALGFKSVGPTTYQKRRGDARHHTAAEGPD